MSWFKKIFKKEEKETLDKGLEKSRQGFFEKMTKAVIGKSKVDDEVLDNLEEILIASDVGASTTIKIIEKIEERVARDKYVNTTELDKILREEISALLLENPHAQSGNIDENKKTFRNNGRWGKWSWENHYHWQTCSSIQIKRKKKWFLVQPIHSVPQQ